MMAVGHLSALVPVETVLILVYDSYSSEVYVVVSHKNANENKKYKNEINRKAK